MRVDDRGETVKGAPVTNENDWTRAKAASARGKSISRVRSTSCIMGSKYAGARTMKRWTYTYASA